MRMEISALQLAALVNGKIEGDPNIKINKSINKTKNVIVHIDT